MKAAMNSNVDVNKTENEGQQQKPISGYCCGLMSTNIMNRT